MTITIQIWNVTDGDAVIAGTSPRKLLLARGFLPGGQQFMTSKVHEGHEPLVQSTAVRELTEWLRAHRPDWNIAIDGPYVRFATPEAP